MQPFVDTGRELMVPTRVAQGERLYRDVEFFHGPLAPWMVAIVEKAAPRSFPARTAISFLVSAGAVEALRRIAKAAFARDVESPGLESMLREGRANPLAAAGVASALAVALPFFLRPGGWLCPFSVDTAIATACLFGLLALPRAGLPGDRSPATAALAALFLFAALVTRLEMGLVGVIAAGIDGFRTPRRLSFVAGSACGSAAIVYLAASTGIPLETLIAHGWLALLRPPEAFRNVYRSFAGLDQPLVRIGELALAGILLLLAGCVLVASAAVAERLRGRARVAATAAQVAGIALLAGCALALAFPAEGWAASISALPPAVRVVPPLCLGLFVWRFATRALKRPVPAPRPGFSDGALLIAAMFSARVFLAAGYVGPYNAYFLPLPILVAVRALLRAADRGAAPIGEALPRLCTWAVAVWVATSMLSTSTRHRGPGWEKLDTPAGSVVLPAVEARTARLVLADLARHLRPGATLTGFPEAGFFDYTLGLRNPLPLDQFWPGHLDVAGEREIVRLLEARPPDAVLRINALAVGEGTRAFGRDYSRILGTSVERDFRPVAIYGPNAHAGAEIGDPDFFIEIRVPAGSPGPRTMVRP